MKSLRAQVTVLTGVLLAAAAGGAAVTSWRSVTDQLTAETDDALRVRAFALSRIIDPGMPRLLPYMEQGLGTRTDGMFLELFDADGQCLGHSSNLSGALPFSEASRRMAAGRMEPVMESIDGAAGTVRTAIFARNDFREGERETKFFVRAGTPVDAMLRGTRDAAIRLGCGAVVLWLAGTGAVWWLTGRWLRPVASLTNLVRETGLDGGQRQWPESPADSTVAALAEAVRGLLQRVDSVNAAQQRFVADASHELRTPLTILRGEIDVALRKPRTAAEYCDVLQSSREEIEDLSRLTENLLLLARSDAGQTMLRREELDLVALAKETAARMDRLATERDIHVAFAGTDACPVSGDRLLLGRVIGNLLENALAYSPAGEAVTLTFSCQEDAVLMEVADTGAGVAPEQLPFLFDRFYRADQARSRHGQGAGLGLAIVRLCVEAHGGTVTVRSEVGRGTAFTVRLPRV